MANQPNENETQGAARPREPLNSNTSGDLTDSPKDEEQMKTEEIIMDLPDVSDIPGQENVRPPRFREMSDITASSDDEEGEGLFDDDDDDDLDTEMRAGTEADVTPDEKRTLERADEDMPTTDETSLRNADLDNVDMEGDPLNESGPTETLSGDDLDTSGTEEDDAMENIGEEDEENNTYSLDDDDDQINGMS